MSLTNRDRILNSNQIFKGVKPLKTKPSYRDTRFTFNKQKPIGPHNFPLTKYTKWEIYGYKKHKLTGIRYPYWLDKLLPTGVPLTPKKVGLDGFYTVKPTYQQW